jgi:transposase
VVDEPQQYSAAEMERMMKVQDVLLKAMAKKMTWWAAAEILGVTDRTMRRWRDRLETDGYSGLADRRKGKPSGKRIPLATVEKVLGLYQESYYDLNIRHFHEKLREAHEIRLSYTWVQNVTGSRPGGQETPAGAAPAEETAAADGWDAAAYRRQQASLAERRSLV